jgi:hypothetical protein
MGDGPPPEEDPEFFFTVHSAWCPFGRSGMLTVELKRPELSDLKWEKILYDEEGNETGTEEVSEIEHGKTALLSAMVKNIEDGDYVNVTVYEEGYDQPNETPLMEEPVQIKDGKIEVRWNVQLNKERILALKPDDRVKFVFVIERKKGCLRETSQAMPAYFSSSIAVVAPPENTTTDDAYVLEDINGGRRYSQKKFFKTDKKEDADRIVLYFDHILPGLDYQLIYIQDEGSRGVPVLADLTFPGLIRY